MKLHDLKDWSSNQLIPVYATKPDMQQPWEINIISAELASLPPSPLTWDNIWLRYRVTHIMFPNLFTSLADAFIYGFIFFDKHFLAIIVCSILTQSNITSDFKRFAASVNNIQCLLKLLLICAFVSFPSRCSNHNNMRLILVTFITILAIVHGVPPIDPSAKTGKYYIHSVCSISYDVLSLWNYCIWSYICFALLSKRRRVLWGKGRTMVCWRAPMHRNSIRSWWSREMCQKS